ncbi:hypothetical protein [Salinimicrobium sp. WS361]|uniref:hypothetical protein n=1 Tax=Salinimicrobium sp. WS361 TaxID=3425123 RepID=UPI003D7023D9
MAYFSNGSEGMVFDGECSSCKYGDKACPIALVQMVHNYSACNNEEASKILDSLVSNDGKCSMKQEFKEDFEVVEDPNQLKLFEV